MPHKHLLDFFHNRELTEMYITISIRAFAMSMINVFVPIYLLQLGYPLAWVLGYFATVNATHGLLSIPVAKLAARFGIKHIIASALPLMMLAYLLLYSLESATWLPVLLPAIVYGTAQALFWVGYHLDFCEFTDKGKRGREIGVAKLVNTLFRIVGPILGGFVVALYGFHVLFICTTLIMLSGMVPMFFSKDRHEQFSFPIKEIFTGWPIRDFLSYIGFGIKEAVELIIWPIFVFGIVESYTNLGFIHSIMIATAFLATLVIGKLTDMRQWLVLRLGSLLTSMLWFIRLFVTSIGQIFSVDAAYGVSASMSSIPFDSINYEKARKAGVVKTILQRELAIQFAKVALYLTVIAIGNLKAGFIIAGVASLLYLLF